MDCPACERDLGLVSHGGAALRECPFCGVVFAKLSNPREAKPPAPPADRRHQARMAPIDARKRAWTKHAGAFLEAHRLQLEAWGADRSALLRLPVLLFMAYIGLRYGVNPEYRSIFDGINLGIHEAGHLIFAPFPTFLTFLGGTLTQLAAPLICAVLLLRQPDYFGVAFCGTWLAANAYHVAIYQADAQARVLPLVTVGGGVPIHDWYYMLSQLELLAYDSHLAWITRCGGFLIAWASVAYGAWILYILWKAEQSRAF